jgi:hypothetical protein
LSIVLLLLLSSFASTSEKDATLWEHNFVYSHQGKVKGTYSEKLSRRAAQKHLAIEQNWRESSEGGTSQTFIGSVVKDDTDLSPVAFFSERSGSISYKVDGRALKGQIITTFKPSNPKGPQIRRTTKSGANVYLSNFLPMILARTVGKKDSLSFKAIVEDPQDKNFEPRSGKAQIVAQKKTVLGVECRLAQVAIDGMEGKWWFASDGSLCEMEIPAAETRLIRVTEDEAKKVVL